MLPKNGMHDGLSSSSSQEPRVPRAQVLPFSAPEPHLAAVRLKADEQSLVLAPADMVSSE